MVTQGTQLFGGGSATLSGQIDASVFSGVGENPYGGLTFVYTVTNLGSDFANNEGIVNFSVSNWAGLQTAVALGNAVVGYDSMGNPVYDSSGVNPLTATRTDGSGDVIDFSFPFDPPNSTSFGPPIFSAQHSWQLIVYTDASSWTTTAAASFTSANDINGANTQNYSATTIAPDASSVPDAGTTVLQLGLGCLALLGVGRRQVRSQS